MKFPYPQASWGGIFVGHVKELTRVSEINTNFKKFDWFILVLISVTRVNSLTRPTRYGERKAHYNDNLRQRECATLITFFVAEQSIVKTESNTYSR